MRSCFFFLKTSPHFHYALYWGAVPDRMTPRHIGQSPATSEWHVVCGMVAMPARCPRHTPSLDKGKPYLPNHAARRCLYPDPLCSPSLLLSHRARSRELSSVVKQTTTRLHLSISVEGSTSTSSSVHPPSADVEGSVESSRCSSCRQPLLEILFQFVIALYRVRI
jgi:hypothetical protein